jgi:hypothetical protein
MQPNGTSQPGSNGSGTPQGGTGGDNNGGGQPSGNGTGQPSGQQSSQQSQSSSNVDLSKLAPEQLEKVLENPNLWNLPRVKELREQAAEAKTLREQRTKEEENQARIRKRAVAHTTPNHAS